MSDTLKLSRRRFLGGTAAAFGIPYVIPSGVLAAPGRPGANDRIVIGHIGVGGMGSGHVQADAAALCDGDANHLASAAKRVQGSPFLCKDYRQLLERKDVDAVMIAAPDHWHALQMVHACQAGKDVYVEKPACRTLEEGRAMIDAAKRTGRVVQVGSQGRSTPAAHAACEYIRNGQIGRVKHVEVWHELNWTGDWGQETAPPPELDWELWLGPARWRPYNPLRCHFNFRWFMDFGGGFVRDRGAHAFSVALWCLDQDHAMPVSVEATGEPQKEGVYDVPVSLEAKWEFKNPDWTLTWSQPGHSPNGAPWGAIYHGDKDTLIVTGGDGGCDTEEKAKRYEPPSGGAHVPPSPGHRENWLECIRTRQQPIMPVHAGCHAALLGSLANISYRLGRKLQWDPVNQRFVGDEEANRFISEPYRTPWSL
jgi:predicted dehydrogenase